MNRLQLKNWNPLFLIIIVGISIRLYKNFSTTLIPGINGGYYPFQVKLLLENSKLGFNDMPFIFYFEALIVKLFSLFTDTDIDTLIINTSKIVDSIFPTLLVIPVYILATKQFKTKKNISNIYIITLCAYSILSLSSISMLTSDYQKNAVGLVWLATCCLGVYLYLNSGKLKYIYITLIFVVLNLLTHIGTLGAFVSFIVILSTLLIIGEKKQLLKHNKKIFILVGIAISAILVLKIIDVKRFDRLIHFISSPLKFFENPILYFLVNNDPKTIGSYIGSYIIFNFLGIFGLIYLLRKKYSLDKRIWIFSLAISLTGLFLCSPLIGINWSFRFLWISYIFIVFQYIFIFSIMRSKRYRLSLLSVFIFSFFLFSKKIISPKKTFITEDSYKELKTLNKKLNFNKKTIILTTHGLEWWTGFSLNTFVGQDYSLTIDEFNKYDFVYVLRQKKGNNYGNSAWSHFLDVEVPNTSTKSFDGDYFEVYKLNEPLNFDKSISKPPIALGKVLSIKKNSLVIKNSLNKYTLLINESTRIKLKEGENNLKEGMRIEIWGNRLPFRNSIEVHTIHQIEKYKTYISKK